MSRTSQTLTNTDLAFLLCTLATTSPHSQSQSQFPKVTLSFETNYGLELSLEPDGSITISLRKPPDLDQCPFDSATPIQSQQQLFTTAPVSRGHGSIDGVLFSSPLRGASMFGTGGASITPARSTPSTSTSRLQPVSASMTRTPSQRSSTQQKDMANKAGISNMNSSNMKIRYYIRPSGLEVNSPSSSHMYYTASASASASAPASTQRQAPHDPASNNTKLRPRTRTLHRVKLSHLQSLYHTHLPSSTGTSTSRKSTSTSWFDAYLDWIDRLDDAIALSRQRAAGQQQTPIAALPVGVSSTGSRTGHGATAGIATGIGGTSSAETGTGTGTRDGGEDRGGGRGRGRGRDNTATKQNQARHQDYPFTDSGERSLWLVEGMLLASWLSLQEGVEGVEYLPLPDTSAGTGTESESSMEGYVYRLETNLQGMEKRGNVNNAGVMMKRLLLEIVRAGDRE